MQFIIVMSKNLLRRKARSCLTIIGIGIGINALVALVSISQGFIALWEEGTAVRGSDLMVVQKSESSNTLFSTVNASLKEDLKKLPGIKAVTSTLFDIVTIDDWPWIPIYGQEPDAFVLSHLNIIEGGGLHSGEKGILLGKIIAQNLNRKVGDEVDIESDIFKVVGIYESSSLYENGLVIMYFDHLQELMAREGQASAFEVKVDNPKLIPTIKDSIESAFPSLFAMEGKEAARSDFRLSLIRSLAWSVSGVALVVAAICAMNTMFMSVFERTREIGILRALGWKRGRVLEMILGESILLSILGGIFGFLLGVLVVKFISLLPQAQSLIYGKYSMKLFLQAMVISLFLGMTGGFYPAFRASRLSPLEAVRYE